MKRFLCWVAILFLHSAATAGGFPADKVYERTANSVVLIISMQEGKLGQLGAGSIVTKSGAILTCAHVVVDKGTGKASTNIMVYTRPEDFSGNLSSDSKRKYKADVVVFDADLDLAVLQPRNYRDAIAPIALARPEEVRIGEEVIAIGHPEQGGHWSMTSGRISGELENQSNIKGRDVYQTDASINRGNSGGPLLDQRGHLVGVNANIARVGAGNLPITGVNFAVKSNVAKRWGDANGFPLPYGNVSMDENDEASSGKETRSPPAGDKLRGSMQQGENIKGGSSGSGAEKRETTDEDRILTPKRPYMIKDFLAEVEREMEDQMEEMRGRIRSR